MKFVFGTGKEKIVTLSLRHSLLRGDVELIAEAGGRSQIVAYFRDGGLRLVPLAAEAATWMGIEVDATNRIKLLP